MCNFRAFCLAFIVSAFKNNCYFPIRASAYHIFDGTQEALFSKIWHGGQLLGFLKRATTRGHRTWYSSWTTGCDTTDQVLLSTWWWKSVSSSSWMPQNSHGIIMFPSAWTAWGWDEEQDLQLLDPRARRPSCSRGFGELLLLNDAKALAGLQPVCYASNMEKLVLLLSIDGLKNPCFAKIKSLQFSQYHSVKTAPFFGHGNRKKSLLQTPRYNTRKY